MTAARILPEKNSIAALGHPLSVPLYKVLLHNDDINTMEHVTKALMRVFKFGLPKCRHIMLEAHVQGVALCVVEPLEPAELHRDQLISFSLSASIEKM
ncbi:MAG: ATP-dependent Clp protease adaptor ClpS [Nitrospirota bacterium]